MYKIVRKKFLTPAIALMDVDAGPLAGGGLVPIDIKDVVGDLECKTDVKTESAHGFDGVAVSLRQVGADPGTRLDRAGGLALDDLAVHVDGSSRFALMVRLYELALRHGVAGVGYRVHHGLIHGAAETESLDEEVIAGYYRLRHGVFSMRGRRSAAQLAVIVDVVVYQRGAVDKLESSGHLYDLGRIVAAGCSISSKGTRRMRPPSNIRRPHNHFGSGREPC